MADPTPPINPNPPAQTKPRFKVADLNKTFFELGSRVDKIVGIVWHHSATADGRGFNWHAIKRYGGVEYGPGVNGPEPFVLGGRSCARSGAHTYFVANKKRITQYNRTYLGLCAVGNYDLAAPPEAIWDTCLKLTRTLMDVYDKIEKNRIIGHWEAYIKHGVEPKKSCPGDLFDMYRFRAEL
jgi:hypothetical protein